MSRSIVVFFAFALLALSTAFATAPTAAPTAAPATAPAVAPGTAPAVAPATAPAAAPTGAPATAPAVAPSAAPAVAPGTTPAVAPSNAPAAAPGTVPAVAPSNAPAAAPGTAPAVAPSGAPGTAPSSAPGAAPGVAPGAAPGTAPGAAPGTAPTVAPAGPPSAPPAPLAPTLKHLNLRIVNAIFGAESTPEASCTFFGNYNGGAQESWVQFTAPRAVNQIAQAFSVPIFKINETWTQLSIFGNCTYQTGNDWSSFTTAAYNATSTINEDPLDQSLTLYYYTSLNYPQIATTTADTAVVPALPPTANNTGKVQFAFAGFVGGWTSTASASLNVTIGDNSAVITLSGNPGLYNATFNVTGTQSANVTLYVSGNVGQTILLNVTEGNAYTIGIVPANITAVPAVPQLQVFQDTGDSVWAPVPVTSGWTIVHAIADGTTINVNATATSPAGTATPLKGDLTFNTNTQQFLTNRGDIVDVTITVTPPSGSKSNATVLVNPWAGFSQLYARLPYNGFLYSSRNATFVFVGKSYDDWVANLHSVTLITSDSDAAQAAAEGVAFVRFTNFLTGDKAGDITYKLRKTIVAPPAAPVAPSAPPAAAPSAAPGVAPSAAPGTAPGAAPGTAPSAAPGVAPGAAPGAAPSSGPSAAPGAAPTNAPAAAPGTAPAATPSAAPSAGPTAVPATVPAAAPTGVPAVSPVTPPAVPTAPTVAPSAAAPTTKQARLMFVSADNTYEYYNYTVGAGQYINDVPVDLSATWDLFILGLPATTGDVPQPNFATSLATGSVIAVYATGDADQTGPYGPKVTWTDEKNTPPGPGPAPEKESIWKKPWIYVIIGGVALVLLGAIAYCIKKKRSQDENKPLLP